MKGKVYLVGAGPGDPGLLTVKAMCLLRQADLVVYDYLANPAHLRHCRPEAVTICVGKRFRYHRFSQNKINRLIVGAARKGQKVVRLKGGDPYLFGRGGEEALFLQRHQIPFEVVPGVTSATACAAYAGIPLTHREHNASVTFLTGHRAADNNLDSVRWEKIADLGGTLVIYMGFYNLSVIARKLVKAGMRADTPAAVIEWGTLPRQRSCVGQLKNIAASVASKKMKAPCIIIIGPTVALGKKLNWFESLPLFGKTVAVTRARERNTRISKKLSRLGAEVLEFPTIEIESLSEFKEMDRAIRELDHQDWAVFTSVYGVNAFFDRLRKTHEKDARALSRLRIAAVGPETAAALEENGISPDLVPPRFETEAIVAEFAARFGNLKGKHVVLFRTDIAPPALEAGLKKLGAEVTRVTAYRTRLPHSAPKEAVERLSKGAVDFVTFTSSSTVDHFVKILGTRRTRFIAQKTRFASIGPVTTATLKKHGLKPACQAKIFTVDGLVEAIRKCR